MIEGVCIVTRQQDGGLVWRYEPEDCDFAPVTRGMLDLLLEEVNEYRRLKSGAEENK